MKRIMLCGEGLVRVALQWRKRIKSCNKGCPPFPVKDISPPCVPSKVVFDTWEANWGKFLMSEMLHERGWQLSNQCFHCSHEEEVVHHIKFHCFVVKYLWEMVFYLLGFRWVFPKTVKNAFISWRGSFVGKKGERLQSQFHCAYFGQFGKRKNV